MFEEHTLNGTPYMVSLAKTDFRNHYVAACNVNVVMWLCTVSHSRAAVKASATIFIIIISVRLNVLSKYVCM